MIFLLCILNLGNRNHTKFQLNLSISFEDIKLLIKFNVQISKCFMCLRFRCKIFLKNSIKVSGHTTMNIGDLKICRIYYSDITITDYTSNERATQTVCLTSVQCEHPSSHGTHRVDSRVRHVHHSL